MKEKEYIFGPVPSRRLGRSLGVDLVPFKVCSYDCIYCQLGKTTNKSVERKEWAPVDLVIAQLKEKLDMKPDYITLSGSGEPTLHSGIGEIIHRIKAITDTPVAVLTNGSLLWLPEVRQALLDADLVVPSLDAGCERSFQYVNRPHADISFAQMLDGLVQFRRAYQGQYWLEVFLTDGVTTVEDEFNRVVECVRMIAPDKVQVNTVTRPPVEDFAVRVPEAELKRLAKSLHENAEIIADYRNVHQQKEFVVRCDDVLTLLQRRPCSVEDIGAGLGIHRNEVVKYIEELTASEKIEKKARGETLYYTAKILIAALSVLTCLS